MFEDKTTEKRVRLNAPTYMRPKRSVLDGPLDIDAGKQVVQQPAGRKPHKEKVLEPFEAVEETPVVENRAVVAEETINESASVIEKAPVVDEVPSDKVEETPVYEFAMEQESGPASETAAEDEMEVVPRRKRMTVFQQFIVFLLLLVVALFLATIYLYTNGWIELPEVVFNMIDKGLSLIP